MSALPPTTAVMMQCRERQKGANALNRCAIARCGMRLVRGRNDQVEIIDSGGGALS
jgi:hypothetical protein